MCISPFISVLVISEGKYSFLKTSEGVKGIVTLLEDPIPTVRLNSVKVSAETEYHTEQQCTQWAMSHTLLALMLVCFSYTSKG